MALICGHVLTIKKKKGNKKKSGDKEAIKSIESTYRGFPVDFTGTDSTWMRK